MQLPRPVTAFLVAAAVAGAGAWLAARQRETAAPNPKPSEAPAIALDAATQRTAEPAAASNAAADKMRELATLSETFRNTTFLIAIRDSGFVCHDLIDVYGGVDTSRTWTATCRDMLAYTVRVTDDGALTVEPMLQQLDSVTPRGVRPPQTLDPRPLVPLERR